MRLSCSATPLSSPTAASGSTRWLSSPPPSARTASMKRASGVERWRRTSQERSSVMASTSVSVVRKNRRRVRASCSCTEVSGCTTSSTPSAGRTRPAAAGSPRRILAPRRARKNTPPPPGWSAGRGRGCSFRPSWASAYGCVKSPRSLSGASPLRTSRNSCATGVDASLGVTSYTPSVRFEYVKNPVASVASATGSPAK